jgi:membrane associated rhomboid family serine protease
MLNTSNNRFDPVFSKNNMLMRLIYANLVVFLGIKILYLPFWLMQIDLSPNQFALNWLAVPAHPMQLLYKPWTVFTYMFLHLGFFHLLSNMIWLYFLGQLFVQFLGEKKMWTVYISGGVAGALMYILFFNLFPVFAEVMPISKALGASASVMAIVAAVGTYAPNFSIRLLLLGDVKLKYIAIFAFVIDVISISNSNSGGHIAHIGGAALGFLFAKQWKKGNDITAWVGSATAFVKAIFSSSKKSRMKVKYNKQKNSQKPESRYEYNSRKKEEQEQVDEILDKISRSGYDSLTKSEKDFLFRASGK